MVLSRRVVDSSAHRIQRLGHYLSSIAGRQAAAVGQQRIVSSHA
jgi:hypothetical protein